MFGPLYGQSVYVLPRNYLSVTSPCFYPKWQGFARARPCEQPMIPSLELGRVLCPCIAAARADSYAEPAWVLSLALGGGRGTVGATEWRSKLFSRLLRP